MNENDPTGGSVQPLGPAESTAASSLSVGAAARTVPPIPEKATQAGGSGDPLGALVEALGAEYQLAIDDWGLRLRPLDDDLNEFLYNEMLAARDRFISARRRASTGGTERVELRRNCP